VRLNASAGDENRGSRRMRGIRERSTRWVCYRSTTQEEGHPGQAVVNTVEVLWGALARHNAGRLRTEQRVAYRGRVHSPAVMQRYRRQTEGR
jgi:hypothetical protein